jgi:hypothetical protein
MISLVSSLQLIDYDKFPIERKPGKKNHPHHHQMNFWDWSFFVCPTDKMASRERKGNAFSIESSNVPFQDP